MRIDEVKPTDIRALFSKLEAESKFDTLRKIAEDTVRIFNFGVAVGKCENNPAYAIWKDLSFKRPDPNRSFATITQPGKVLKPGMQYGHFREGYFPKVGNLRKPLTPYREMVKRRHKDLSQSQLEAATVYHLHCAGYLRKDVEEEIQRHTPPPASQTSFWQMPAICNVYRTSHLERITILL